VVRKGLRAVHAPHDVRRRLAPQQLLDDLGRHVHQLRGGTVLARARRHELLNLRQRDWLRQQHADGPVELRLQHDLGLRVEHHLDAGLRLHAVRQWQLVVRNGLRTLHARLDLRSRHAQCLLDDGGRGVRQLLRG
jgi:hypothetical protein